MLQSEHGASREQHPANVNPEPLAIESDTEESKRRGQPVVFINAKLHIQPAILCSHASKMFKPEERRAWCRVSEVRSGYFVGS